MKTCLVLVTCKDIREARKIAQDLLSQRLVACVNILPGLESHYRWQGKIQKSPEVLLMAKTTSVLVRKVSAAVRKLHSYECPGIEVVPVQQQNSDFLRWIGMETC